MEPSNSYEYYVKLDGLSYSATPSDVIKFLNDVEIVERESGVRFLKNSAGRPTGECVIKLGIDEDLKKVLAHHGKYMGKRYVNVIKSNRKEYEDALNMPPKDFVVRLRGLPYSARIEDVDDFFRDLKIVHNGIFIPKEESGRPLGVAYVKFANESSYNEAFAYDKKNMGSRYIEVFPSSSDELNRKLGRYESRSHRSSSRYLTDSPPSLYNSSRGYYDRMESYDRYSDPHRRPSYYNRDYDRYRESYNLNSVRDSPYYQYDQGRRGSSDHVNRHQPTSYNVNYHVIRVEGLPYEATKSDIRQFFSPENPSYINIILGKDGRTSGYGDVYFKTHEECLSAMKKDNNYLGGRYLKLKMFSKKPPSPIRTDIVQKTNVYYPTINEVSQLAPTKEMYQTSPQQLDPYSYPTISYPFFPTDYGPYYNDLALMSSSLASSFPQNYVPTSMYPVNQPAENSNPYTPQIPIVPSATVGQVYNDGPSATSNETQRNQNFVENSTSQFPKY